MTPADSVEESDVPSGTSVSMELVRGNATEEELAALIAVLSDAYTDEEVNAVASTPHVSAWERTQRSLRTPLRRDVPWGRFSG